MGGARRILVGGYGASLGDVSRKAPTYSCGRCASSLRGWAASFCGALRVYMRAGNGVARGVCLWRSIFRLYLGLYGEYV